MALGSKNNFGEEYAASYDALYQDKNYEKECDFIEAIILLPISRKLT